MEKKQQKKKRIGFFRNILRQMSYYPPMFCLGLANLTVVPLLP